MVLKFKPQFWRDINKVKEDKEIMSYLSKIFKNVEDADSPSRIHNIKPLMRFEAQHRIKLYLDKQRDFRIGIYIHKNTVWFARLLHRSKIYKENW